uniref:C2 domain-containing protein n=1 Tax=Eutreptiella gymnastica TaxID=73025 RepID=A0A7S4LLX0_9EUGL
MASPRNVVSQSYPGAGGPEGPSWKTAEEMWTGTHMEKIKEEGSFVLILNRLEYLPRTWLLNCPSPYVVINLLEGGVVLQTLKSQQCDKTVSPVYEEKFVLRLPPSVATFRLQFSVYDGFELPDPKPELLATTSVLWSDIATLKRSKLQRHCKIYGETAAFGYEFFGPKSITFNGNIFFSIKPVRGAKLPNHLRPPVDKETVLEFCARLTRQGLPGAALAEEANGDHAIDLGAAVMDPEALRGVFQKCDVEQKGYLTRAQMRRFYSRLDDYGLDTADHEIERALRHTMSSTAARKSDRITYDQFSIIMLYFMRSA